MARGTPGAELHGWRSTPLKASQELQLDGAKIEKVSLSGDIDLVVASGTAALVVAGPETALVQQLRQYRMQGTLRLELASPPQKPQAQPEESGGARPSARLVVGLRLPEIPNISHEGHGDVFVYNAQQQELFLNHTGKGSVTAFGKVEGVAAVLDGEGDMHLEALAAQHAIAVLGGSGTLELQASGSVTARLNGAGKILIHGNPLRVNETVSGTGTIEYR